MRSTPFIAVAEAKIRNQLLASPQRSDRKVFRIEAEDLLRRALAIFEKSAGPESTRTAEVLNSLAVTYMSARKYSEAAPLFERSLDFLAKVPSPPRVTVQTTIRDLKMTYQLLKMRDKAESLDRRFSHLGKL
jgi:hypothetical protein